jgi:hypothetical protein
MPAPHFGMVVLEVDKAEVYVLMCEPILSIPLFVMIWAHLLCGLTFFSNGGF